MASPPNPSREIGPGRVPSLKSAVEHINEAVLITEGAPLTAPGPRITYVNPAFTEITGYSPAEVIGKSPRLLQGPATESWVLARLRRRLEQGVSFEGEAINYRKDGTPYVNHWSVSPIRDANDTITHWVSVQRDVTEYRRTSERLLNAQERERARMVRTFHDELGGELVALQMLVEQVRDQTPADQPTAPPLNKLEAHIDTLSTTVRRLTDAFSSRVLSDFGLSAAITHLTTNLEDEEGLTVDLHNEVASGERLSPLLERVVFRTLRDTLTPLARRGNANTAQVLLNKTNRKVRLHVISPETEFDLSGAVQGTDHPALSAMTEQIDRLNGTLSIDASPKNGIRLTVTLPLVLMSPHPSPSPA